MKYEVNLFVASTPYHMLVACCMYKKEDILINVGKQAYSLKLQKMIIDVFGENIFNTLSLNDYKDKPFKLFRFRKNIKCIVKLFDDRKIRNIFVFNDVSPEIQRIIQRTHISGRVILIEEGIGLYRDIIKRHRFVFKYFGKILFGSGFEDIDRIGESKSINEIVCRNGLLLSDKQKEKKIIAFKLTGIDKIKKNIGYIEQVNSVHWFIGQPLVEDGVLSESGYLNIIHKLSKMYPDLAVKPHPRENRKKYESMEHVTVIEENDIPIELMISTKNKLCFFTVYSSAIFTMVDYGRSIVLYKAERLHMPKQIEEIFLGAAVYIPDSWDEVSIIAEN